MNVRKVEAGAEEESCAVTGEGRPCFRQGLRGGLSQEVTLQARPKRSAEVGVLLS